jgi:transcriptional regulator with XRE-family HTH domain
LPKEIFIRDYPSNPKNFGERLRKARMNADLQIKDLAEMLGVRLETVINWELRGTQPRGRKIQKKLHLFMEKNN